MPQRFQGGVLLLALGRDFVEDPANWDMLRNASAMTAALEQSVEELGVPYVDLMLVHYPASWSGEGGPAMRKEGWKAMEAWARSPT